MLAKINIHTAECRCRTWQVIRCVSYMKWRPRLVWVKSTFRISPEDLIMMFVKKRSNLRYALELLRLVTGN